MDPHLRRLHQEIASAVADSSTEQLSWHPPGKWCTAEILEHLYLTYTATTKGISRILDAGTPQANTPTLKQRAQSLLVVGFGYMPRGRQAPKQARPRGLPNGQVCAEIGEKIAEMDAILTRCAARFGARSKVLDHPLLGPFSIDQWRKFHLVHGLHHLRQIHRLKVLWTERTSLKKASAGG